MLSKADIQRLRSLRDKKQREALGLFVAEGEKVVGELLAAGVAFDEIYATQAWFDQRPTSQSRVPPPPAKHVSADEMSRASHFPTPSSVLAVGRLQRTTLTPLELEHGLTLALDGVQDPGNVGTLLRVADWFALDRVLLSPDCADLFHQKTINASMGSFARVRVITCDLAAALADAKVPVIGCDLAGDDVHQLRAPADAVLVIGSEGRGLSVAVASHLTQRITIPRLGLAESLNAAVAAAIVCDNLRRAQGQPPAGFPPGRG